jgi:hypothetical protein
MRLHNHAHLCAVYGYILMYIFAQCAVRTCCLQNLYFRLEAAMREAYKRASTAAETEWGKGIYAAPNVSLLTTRERYGYALSSPSPSLSLSLCMYVCVCVCMCVYIYIYICICMCVYVYIYHMYDECLASHHVIFSTFIPVVCVCVCIYIYIYI